MKKSQDEKCTTGLEQKQFRSEENVEDTNRINRVCVRSECIQRTLYYRQRV